MSIKLMSQVWDMELPIGEKMLLLKLADRANDDGECWPGQEELARQCSMSVRAIRDNLNRLVERGLIEIKYRNFGMRRGSNVYCMNLSETVKSRPATAAARGDSRPADCDKPTGNGCRSYKEEPSLNSIIMAEQSDSTSLPADSIQQDDDQDGIQFDVVGGLFCNIHDEQWARWEKAYPKIDVDAELAKAEIWYIANPKRRKKNHGRFITNWLAKANGVAVNPTLRRAA